MSKLELALTAAGWSIRILIIMNIAPEIQRELFVPFVQAFLNDPSLDPWSKWLAMGKSADAFPYGVVMLAIHAPFVFVGQMFDSFFGGFFEAGRLAQVGFACSLLVFDAWLFRSLLSFMELDEQRRHRFGEAQNSVQSMTASRFLLVFYWLSPLLLYVNYIHGQTDIIPTFFVIQSIIFLERHKLVLSGLLLAIAMSAKLSVGLIVPFLMIYMAWYPTPFMDRLRWFIAFAVGGLLICFSMWLIPGQLEIVLRNEALGDTLSYGIDLPNNRTVLLFPLIYGGSLALIFFMAPLDRRSLYTLVGLALMSVVAVSSANVGWYLWALPLLLYSGIQSSGRLLAVLFSFWSLVVINDASSRECWWPESLCTPETRSLTESVLTTAITGLALMIAIRMIVRLVADNPSYRLVNRPVFVGIAGDSGSGKDTMVGALSRLVGSHRSAVVLGDDYHLYARGAKMWKALTHLNPRANDLHKMDSDIDLLVRGKTVRMHHYDHALGVFTRPRKIGPAKLTLVNGLHAFYSPKVADLFDLKIFLKMDEPLRRGLKVARDVARRGALVKSVLDSIDARLADSERYVTPQADSADLICELKCFPSLPGGIDGLVQDAGDINTDHRLFIEAKFRSDVNLNPLIQAFVAYTGSVAFPLATSDEVDRQILVFYGAEINGEDVALLCEKLLSSTLEFLAGQAEFLDGHQGVLQLLFLYMLEHNVNSGKRYA